MLQRLMFAILQSACTAVLAVSGFRVLIGLERIGDCGWDRSRSG